MISPICSIAKKIGLLARNLTRDFSVITFYADSFINYFVTELNKTSNNWGLKIAILTNLGQLTRDIIRAINA